MTRVHDVDMERHAPTGAGEDRAITVDSALELHPKVALRPEPFGALAYHYGNRRLVFLRHPDVVAVVKTLADHRTLGEALSAAGVSEKRWPSFVKAVASLCDSEVVRER